MTDNTIYEPPAKRRQRLADEQFNADQRERQAARHARDEGLREAYERAEREAEAERLAAQERLREIDNELADARRELTAFDRDGKFLRVDAHAGVDLARETAEALLRVRVRDARETLCNAANGIGTADLSKLAALWVATRSDDFSAVVHELVDEPAAGYPELCDRSREQQAEGRASIRARIAALDQARELAERGQVEASRAIDRARGTEHLREQQGAYGTTTTNGGEDV